MERNSLYRKFFFAGFLICSLLLASGYFIEYRLFAEPCSLCILQRFIYFFLAFVFLLGTIHGPKNWGVYFYSLLNISAATLGALLAGRQIALQSLPHDQLPLCTPGLERLLKIHPLTESLMIILRGSGECGKDVFYVLGISLAHWSFFSFTLIAFSCIFIIHYHKKKADLKSTFD